MWLRGFGVPGLVCYSAGDVSVVTVVMVTTLESEKKQIDAVKRFNRNQ